MNLEDLVLADELGVRKLAGLVQSVMLRRSVCQEKLDLEMWADHQITYSRSEALKLMPLGIGF